VIIATVSLVLVGLILEAILMVVLMSDTRASIVASLVASLVVGYVFALKIQEESRIRAIGVIVVLAAFTLLIFSAIWIANDAAYPWFKDSINSTFNTTGWTDYDWSAYSALMVSVDTIMGAVISFIGLYVGSILRRPSAKTKE
jgi:FtsH-binding integral membrane protein